MTEKFVFCKLGKKGFVFIMFLFAFLVQGLLAFH